MTSIGGLSSADLAETRGTRLAPPMTEKVVETRRNLSMRRRHVTSYPTTLRGTLS